jgi:hypothetical protein
MTKKEKKEKKRKIARTFTPTPTREMCWVDVSGTVSPTLFE